MNNRIHMKNYYDRSWKSNPNAVYCGRPSKYGNPYKIGKDGTREEVIEKYKEWLRGKLKDNPKFLDPLIGKDLVCYCKTNESCHCDVIISYLKVRELMLK